MNTIIINKQILDSDKSMSLNVIEKVYESLRDLNEEYPNFNNWFWDIVVPNISLGTRSIVVKINNDDILCGLSILKHSDIEKKICTFRILDSYKNLGIGSILMRDSISLFREEIAPTITVSEKRIGEFYPLLAKFGFRLYQKYDNYYKQGDSEYSFNGPLEESLIICNSLIINE